MNRRNLAAVGAIAAVAAVAAIAGNTQVAQAADQEKCYGVVKAGQNDCQTATSSCQGTSKVDGQKDAWVFVPAGLCDKIVGASTGQPAS